MTRVIRFPKADDADDEKVDIGRDAAYYEASKKLSDLIKTLPIDGKTNDLLIVLILEQVSAAEKSAFYRGTEFGLKVANHIKKADG